MKKLIIVLTLVCVYEISYGQELTPPGNGQALLEYCQYGVDVQVGPWRNTKEAMIKGTGASYCIAFIRGIVIGHQIMTTVVPTNKGLFCVPDKSDIRMWVKVVLRYLEKHPEQLHLSDGELVAIALVEAYPCKNK